MMESKGNLTLKMMIKTKILNLTSNQEPHHTNIGIKKYQKIRIETEIRIKPNTKIDMIKIKEKKVSIKTTEKEIETRMKTKINITEIGRKIIKN